MTMLRVKGDLLELAKHGYFDVIVQGCNCFCTMGSGIARQIREKYPAAYEADCTTKKGDRDKLGTFTSADVGGFLIVNAYTQYNYNRPGESADHFSYKAFWDVLSTLAGQMSRQRFGFPMIGMGRAGGDPHRILPMLEAFSLVVATEGGSVTLVEYAV